MMFNWDHQIILGFSVIFCHSFVSDEILKLFFTKPQLILACDKYSNQYLLFLNIELRAERQLGHY
jgi:hypothetical protein